MNGLLKETIIKLNETIRILQSNMASKDSLIVALQAINDCSNVTVSPIVTSVPGSDEMDHFRGKTTQ